MMTDTPDRAKRTEAAPNCELQYPKSAGFAYLLVGAVTLAYYTLVNFLYFRLNGWPASPGPDIWYFLAVSKGLQSLSPLDLSYWLVKPLGNLRPESGFVALNVLSVSLHLTSTLLVYHYLGRLLRIDPAARLLSTLLFAALPHNVIPTTAFFTHFTVAQPFLILAFGRLLPWCLRRTALPDVWGTLCLMEGMLIGPEGWILLICLSGVALSKRVDVAASLRKVHCPPVVAVILACAAFAWIFPLLFGAWSWLVFRARGIDLSWQHEILTADLLPVNSLLAFFGFHLVWAATAVFALVRRRFLPALLLVLLLILSWKLGRGYYALELGGFCILMVLLFTDRSLEDQWVILLPVLMAWLVAFGLFGAKPCVVRPHLVRLARSIQARAAPDQRIACSPSFGFFFQGWTGLPTTDDLHLPPGGWAELAAMRPMEAGRVMKDRGVGFVVFTSWDYRSDGNRVWTSAGLRKALDPVGDSELKFTLVARAMDRQPPLVRPMEVIAAERAGGGADQAICLAPGR